MISCIEQDKSALMQIDWSTGEQKVLFESQRADVVGGIFDARTFEPHAVQNRSGATGVDGIERPRLPRNLP